MPKLLAPILTIAIVAALAGALYFRANTSRIDEASSEGATSESTAVQSVEFAVRSADGTVEIREYDLESKTTSDVNPSTLGLLWPARYTQSSYVCATADEPTAPTALRVMCDIGRDNALLLAAFDGDEKVVSANINPGDLELSQSASDGYLVPVAVADDKSAIYLGLRVEIESWIAGLWRLDVATGEVSEIEYVRETNLYYYDINPTTKQLVGVTFVPPESLGEYATGPFQIALVDLSTGEGNILRSQDFLPYENPMLSRDGLAFAYYEDGNTMVSSIDGDAADDIIAFHGVMKDWFGDTVVFDRDGNLFLYDLKTKTETQLTHESDATVEYVGVVKE